MGKKHRAPAWAHAFWSCVLALAVVIALTGRARAEEDDEPAAGGEPAAAGEHPTDDDQPAAGGHDQPADDDPPTAGGDAPAPDDEQPAAADDDDQPAAAAAAPAADDDGDPDNDLADLEGLDPALLQDSDPGPGDTSDDYGAFDPSDDALEATEDDAEDVAVVMDEDGEPYIQADYDGDGKVSAEELAEEQAFDTAFADIPDEVTDDALDHRSELAELMPSIGMAQFRTLVHLAKKKVLERMEKKIAAKADARMATIGKLVALFSLAGLLLLFMPFVLAKRHPGQMGALFKYSAIAALTFVVTVNLFGGIMLGMRKVQSAVGNQTNPQLRLAAGFFDTLDHNAERYLVTGREIFAPTLEQLDGKSDAQPAAVLIANGQKVVEKASVFKTVAGWFQKISFVFGALPIVLLAVTMVLFVLAIKPTLLEIIRLPAVAAAGAAGATTGVVGRAMKRVGGELVATLCTLAVLLVLTLVAGFVMGRVCEPMLDTLITCFARAIDYLQFVDDASVGQVGLMLLSVLLALAFNLAVVILAMSFFLGRTQKIFQQRFNQGIPLSAHARWWRWGIPSVVGALCIPVAYLALAKIIIAAVERKVMASVTDAEKVNWSALLLLSPALLVLGFVFFLWAARGVKALGFLGGYKVKLVAQAHAQATAPVPAA